MAAVEEEKTCRADSNQWTELLVPSNRKRIILGILIFIFMQFAGSNAIK